MSVFFLLYAAYIKALNFIIPSTCLQYRISYGLFAYQHTLSTLHTIIA